MRRGKRWAKAFRVLIIFRQCAKAHENVKASGGGGGILKGDL